MAKAPIAPDGPTFHIVRRRQFGARRRSPDENVVSPDTAKEGSMKVQTDIKAGFLCLDVDIEVDIDLSFGGGKHGCGRNDCYKRSRKC
jgi:hypothetical protein